MSIAQSHLAPPPGRGEGTADVAYVVVRTATVPASRWAPRDTPAVVLDTDEALDVRRTGAHLADTVAPLTTPEAAAVAVVTVDTSAPDWQETLRRGCVLVGAELATRLPGGTLRVLVAPEILDTEPVWAVRTVVAGLRAGPVPRRGSAAAATGPALEIAHPRSLVPGLLDGATCIADAVDWARELVERPPNELGPEEFVASVEDVVQRAQGLTLEVWDEHRLAVEGCGGTLAVAAGSARPARMLVLGRRATHPGPETVLVGKGITFDSGGLSVKHDATQTWMKADMAGAAAVVATVLAADALGLETNVAAIVPLAENLSGPGAYRPGDVIRHPNGLTTEITNTDAEGRLLLADALCVAARREPAAIIDVATLTSAVLGDRWWFTLANDRGLVAELVAAGETTGDPGWQLPLLRVYAEDLESRVADARHFSFEQAGHDHLMAPLFLEPFVDGRPWAHVDVAGTAYWPSARPYGPAGATGSPISALVGFLENRVAAVR